jgi:ADP-ribose pyrophosphatase YjhB (NUDIX family)
MTAIRHAGRALVLDESDRILLFRFRDPNESTDHLATPGGGLQQGETYEAAARREVQEELLLSGVELGPPIWNRVSEFDFLGTWTQVFERFFLLRVLADEIRPYQGHLGDENVIGREWWTLDDIEETDEAIWPSRLASLIRDLLRDGVPSEPVPIRA